MGPPKHLKGIVTQRRFITDNLWIVRLRTEERVTFTSGQYVTIGLPLNGKLVERPYSVASSPYEQELEFFLEVVPGGKLSPQLYRVPVGGEVRVRPVAKGRFQLDTQSGNRNHFMVATVTGVAPFISMVRALAEPGVSVPGNILILHSASVSCELAYREELGRRAEQARWFHYVPTISRVWLDPQWPGERGRAEDVARKYMDERRFEASSTTVYLCGNPYMIRNMEGILERAGFSKNSVKREIYWPAASEKKDSTVTADPAVTGL
jgi:ferredoxin/flavodoxin---NADP+ reductase